MAFQSVPDTAEVVVRYDYSGRIWTNTFYAKFFGAYDQEDLQTLADITDEWVAEELFPLISSQISYKDVQVRGLEEVNDYTAESNASTGFGTDAVGITTPQTSFAIKRLSGFTGRSARGRIYIPPPGTDTLQANRNYLLAVYADAWVDALNALTGVWSSELWSAGIVSRYHEGSQRTFGLVFPLIGWAYTDLRLDTQRGRLVEV